MITITTPITKEDRILMETILFEMQEDTEKENPKEETPVFRSKGRPWNYTKYPGYITRDAIYKRAGAGNYLAFRSACKSVGVKGIVNDGHRCYLPLEYAEEVVDAMKRIMGLD